MIAPAAAIGALRGQVAPITAITLFGLSMSMSYPLFGLLLERMGASGLAIGINQTGPALAIIAVAPVMPVLTVRLGLARVMVGATVLLAATMLLMPLWQDFWYWTTLRLVSGAAATALFFASEYWIVGAAPDASRGRIVGIYTMAVSAAFMAGPVLLRAIGIGPVLPFLVSAAIVLLGLLPILWGRDSAPVPEPEGIAGPRAQLSFFRTDPSVVLGVVLYGTIEFGVLGLVPVWAVRSGVTEAGAVTLLALFGLGSIALQWPVGWAADRYDRLRLLRLAGAACVAVPLGLILAAPVFGPMATGMVVWGGLAVALYSLALIEMGARYRGARLAEANAAIILGYGFGALAAPMAAGLAMDLVPPDGLMWLAAGLAAAYLGLVRARSRAKAA